MFDIGFFELVIIFVLGLIVLGPERLPRVARGVGRWIGKARRTARNLQYELQRELDLEELRRRSEAHPINQGRSGSGSTPAPGVTPSSTSASAAAATPAVTPTSATAPAPASTDPEVRSTTRSGGALPVDSSGPDDAGSSPSGDGPASGQVDAEHDPAAARNPSEHPDG